MYREYMVNKDSISIKSRINEYSKNIHKMITEYKACHEINRLQGRNLYHQVDKLSKYKANRGISTLEEN